MVAKSNSRRRVQWSSWSIVATTLEALGVVPAQRAQGEAPHDGGAWSGAIKQETKL